MHKRTTFELIKESKYPVMQLNTHILVRVSILELLKNLICSFITDITNRDTEKCKYHEKYSSVVSGLAIGCLWNVFDRKYLYEVHTLPLFLPAQSIKHISLLVIQNI